MDEYGDDKELTVPRVLPVLLTVGERYKPCQLSPLTEAPLYSV